MTFPTSRAFAVSALAYAIVATGVSAADVLFNLPEVLHMPALFVAMVVFGLTAVALHTNPSGAASRKLPNGRALALFFVLHIGVALQAIFFPLGRGTEIGGTSSLAAVLGAAGAVMIFLGTIGALMATFRREVVRPPADSEDS